MKLASTSISVKMVIIGLLLTCMFTSISEAYVCPDCSPRETLSVLSGKPSEFPFSQQAFNNADQGAIDQGRHSLATCPVCLNLLSVVSDHIQVFFTAVDRVFQDPPHLFLSVTIPIYKPPRIAS
jgi:hypothetical protein